MLSTQATSKTNTWMNGSSRKVIKKGSLQSQYQIVYEYNIEPRDVIQKMMSGIDISLVDPRIYPSLVPLLKTYLEKAQNEGDSYKIREYEFYIRYIEYQPRREELTRILYRPKPPPPVKKPVLSEDRVSTEVNNILKTEKIPSYKNQEEVDLIVHGLRERRVNYISEGDYLQAEKAEELSRKLFSSGQLSTVESIQQDKEADLKNKLDTSISELEASKKKWEELLQTLRSKANEEFAELEQIHNDEIKELEDLYNQPPPPNIRKYSQALLNLRRRETAMLSSKLYAQAAKIKDQADELQEKEDQEQLDRWHNHISFRIQQTKEEHMRQLNKKKVFWKTEEQKMILLGNKEIKNAEMAIEHLSSNFKETHEARKLTTVMKKETKMKPKNKVKKFPKLELKTPRRDEKMTEFRQRQLLNSHVYTITHHNTPKKVQMGKRPSTSLL